MEIEFYGAAKTVTGSLTILRACGQTIMIDCGLFQGSAEKKFGQRIPYKAKKIDYVFLTHAHIDHSGKLPYLYKNGFRGPVYCTSATKDLCEIMLLDSAFIQESDAQWQNKKNLRAGKKLVEPLYTVDDAENALSLIVGYEYGPIYELCEGIKFQFVDAGHLLGSASIIFYIKEKEITKKVVFSGDIGNLDQPIIKDPEYIEDGDIVIMEATYGNRLHEAARLDTKYLAHQLKSVVQETFKRGGNVIIPSFSVGRTQEILFFFRYLYYAEKFKVPVYVDSPLSIKATNIFKENVNGYFDDEALQTYAKGHDPIIFPNMKNVSSVTESQALNKKKSGCVIISSSGMCEAGRIRHHLKYNLYRKECSIIFTGYQAAGTLGQLILQKPKKVKLLGEEIAVKASIHKIKGLSGHADKEGLIKWINSYTKKPKKIFIVHADAPVGKEFEENLKSIGFDATAVSPFEKYEF